MTSRARVRVATLAMLLGSCEGLVSPYVPASRTRMQQRAICMKEESNPLRAVVKQGLLGVLSAAEGSLAGWKEEKEDEHSAEHKALMPLDDYDKAGFSLISLMTAIAAGRPS